MEEIAKAGILKATSSSVETSKGLIERLLGPTAEYLGLELRDLVKARRENFERIAHNADSKLGERGHQPGSVPPKVLREIWEEGSWANDDIAVEYYGGVLASSRSGVSRDDRGAAYAKLVAQMTSYQLRAHYFFYTKFREAFAGTEYSLNDGSLTQYCGIWMDEPAIFSAMALEQDEDSNVVFGDLFFGLHKLSLIGAGSRLDNSDGLKEHWVEVPDRGLVVTPTVEGVNLMLWATGQGHLSSSDFFTSRFEEDSFVDILFDGRLEAVTNKFAPGNTAYDTHPS